MAEPTAEGSAGGRSLTVLGCDGSYPGPGGAASGYLVRSFGTTIWVDAGSGTLANLQRHVEPGQVDAVILSHEHPDHWSDIEPFAVVSRYWLERTDIPVYAPSGLRSRTYHAQEGETLDWWTIEPGERVVIGDLAVTFSATDHSVPTRAMRFDPLDAPEGDLSGSLAYTADTGPDWSVAELGHGIGTLLSEASFTAEFEGGQQHLSGRQAGAMAADARVGRLVVTHRWPTVAAAALAEEASTAFSRAVVQATVDLVVQW